MRGGNPQFTVRSASARRAQIVGFERRVSLTNDATPEQCQHRVISIFNKFAFQLLISATYAAGHQNPSILILFLHFDCMFYNVIYQRRL